MKQRPDKEISVSRGWPCLCDSLQSKWPDMPPKAADVRGKQMELIAGISYDKSVDKELGQLIDKCAADLSSLDAREKANVLLAQRNYSRLIKTPRSLATKMAELESRGYEVWAEARAQNDWNKFAPVLKEWIDLRKEQAKLVEPDMDVYDFCLDMYERGLKKERVRTVFAKLKDSLIDM